MRHAKKGDTVRVHYVGKLQDGKVFDSSIEREPMKLTLGAGQVIPGFEQAVEGMAPGQARTVEIPAADAFGERHEDRVVKFDRSALQQGTELQVGQQVQLTTHDGQPVAAVLTEVSDTSVTADANHPLAGKPLVFEVNLVNIV